MEGQRDKQAKSQQLSQAGVLATAGKARKNILEGWSVYVSIYMDVPL